MIHECSKPMPCTTPVGDGYIWYIKSNGMYDSDELTIIMSSDGSIKHFTTEQVKIWFNATYGINKAPLPF